MKQNWLLQYVTANADTFQNLEILHKHYVVPYRNEYEHRMDYNMDLTRIQERSLLWPSLSHSFKKLFSRQNPLHLVAVRTTKQRHLYLFKLSFNVKYCFFHADKITTADTRKRLFGNFERLNVVPWPTGIALFRWSFPNVADIGAFIARSKRGLRMSFKSQSI